MLNETIQASVGWMYPKDERLAIAPLPVDGNNGLDAANVQTKEYFGEL